ncbi:MAG: Uma2 family endonuclease [Ardenticatenaceae bacterium]
MPILQATKELFPQTSLLEWENKNENGSASGFENGLEVSEEVYWQRYYDHPDFNYEWVNGHLEEKPVSTHATVLMYQWLLSLLRHYFEAYPIGTISALETGFRVKLPPTRQQKPTAKKKRTHQKNIRKPDFAVVLHDNPVSLLSQDNRYDGIFDLCVEAISLSTKKAKERDTVQKKEEYELSGVPEYYILDDSGQEVAFFRLNQWGLYKDIEPIDGDIIQSEVLPGFRFRISDLYKQPTLKEMVEDEFYRDFVLPAYTALKQRAEEAEREAEEEKQAKEEALQRVEEEKQAKEEERRAKEEAQQRAEEERRAKEEERRAKEEAKMLLEKERQEKERLLAKLKELGISL